MSTFEQFVGAATKRPAPRTFKLRPEHFAESWGRRPAAAFDIGLRVPGEQDYRNANAEAEKAQDEAVEHAARNNLSQDRQREAGIKAFNTRLIDFCVARGVCNQHNVVAPHPYFELADDEIPLALTSKAIGRIFDEIERLAVDQSPIFLEATSDELLRLATWLSTDDPFSEMDPTKRGRCLRYLKLVLDTLNEDG